MSTQNGRYVCTQISQTIIDGFDGTEILFPECVKKMFPVSRLQELATELNIRYEKAGDAFDVDAAIVGVALDKLKAEWVEDGCWDIESSEGFEPYHDELLAFRKEWEAARDERLAARNKVEAEKMDVSLPVYLQIRDLQAAASHQRQTAKTLLVHYFSAAGLVTHQDNESEIEAIVDSMVDAAVMTFKSEVMLEHGRNASPVPVSTKADNSPSLG